MRASVGLRLPDKRIGLSAHAFQQAVAGKEVWLSRAIRNDEAETVPSRWLNRIVNLIGGLGDPGHEALQKMRARGATWLGVARQLTRPEASIPPEPRPAPAPPTQARPTQISVTQIETLIRDPYAIYGQKVLGLRALPPLRLTPDARLRGTVIHDALARFLRQEDSLEPLEGLTEAIDQELGKTLPWPALRRLWRGRLLSVAPWFLAQEAQRRAEGTPRVIEERGHLDLAPLGIRLTAKAGFAGVELWINDIYEYIGQGGEVSDVEKEVEALMELFENTNNINMANDKETVGVQPEIKPRKKMPLGHFDECKGSAPKSAAEAVPL